MPRFVCLALSLSLLGSVAMAQGDAMTELYGQGVHLYNSGDYGTADQILSKVVDSGSLDPRAHYFRGLVREMQGGGGDVDFETGARLEAEGKRVVAVGLALSRVQGTVRTKIETARRDARVLLRTQQLLTEQARREAGNAGMPSADEVPAIPSETVEPSQPLDSDPFGAGGLRSENSTVDPVQPVAPEVDSANNPFGDDPTPPATETPASDAPGADPFGGGQPATGADPFGGGQPATGTDPFGGQPATGADPFGGGAGTTDTPPASDDPFGTGL